MKPENFGAQLSLFHSLEYLTGGNVNVPELMRARFGEPAVTPIPIPHDAPAEIPRYEMRLGDLAFKFSNVRADMISESGNLTAEQIDNFIEVVIGFGVTINRVGYALNKRYSDVQTNFLESNLNLSSERFGRELANVSEASWRINKKKDLGVAGNCNNISTLNLEIDDETKNAVLVRDVNTEQERTLQLRTVAEVKSVVTLLGDEALRNDNISL